MDEATKKWLAQKTKVCTCTGITRKTIDEAIAAGAKTVGDVNRKTGASRGSCGGKGCGPRIKAILEEQTGE